MLTNEGHRKRVKDRFCNEGLDHFEDQYVLEILLFYCIQRKDTKPIAKALLNHFGTFHQVLDASREELMCVEGIGEQTALFLSLVREVVRYYQINRFKIGEEMETDDDCRRILTEQLSALDKEAVYILCMDAKRKLLACKKVCEGNVNSTNISIRKIMEIALRFNASSVVLAHNHPSGFAMPSPEDIQTTAKISKTLREVDVVLVDHIVVAENDYVSMLQSGYYSFA